MNTLPEIVCRQLEAGESLTLKQKRQIARLIFQTDPYIYPAMFGSEDSAMTIIPLMFEKDDAMFNYNNLYVGTIMNDIVGVVLWHRGSLAWDESVYKEVIAEQGLQSSPYLKQVKENYFSTYQSVDDSTVSIINVCVSEDMRGTGIGSTMMRAFLSQIEESDTCELLVLSENQPAIHVYEQCGFALKDKLNGFSIDNRDVPCRKMVRPAKKY